MRASIGKSKIRGKVRAPSSKSYTIRGLMAAALAKGESEIIHPLGSDDTEAALDILTEVGVSVLPEQDSWRVNGGNFREPAGDLFCRDSATTLRFMTAISSLIPGRCRLTTGSSLATRPMEPLIQALRQLGVDCRLGEQSSVVVEGGQLKGGLTELPGNISSQYVSALLFISPFANEGTRIRLTTPLESQPYVLMTLECLKIFGITVNSSADLRKFEATKQTYRPAKYTVEGDWSSASYLLAVGALGGEIEVENLNPASLQGDRVILDFLKDMGANVTIGANSITVKSPGLKAIKADFTDCIDLLPTVAVLAATADGTSELSGIARARLKESNRVAAVKEGLERMGIKVSEEEDRLTITGAPVRGSVIDSQGDHRIAMAFSLLGLVAGQTVIDDAECVTKTYPEFWDTIKSIGGEVKIDGK